MILSYLKTVLGITESSAPKIVQRKAIALAISRLLAAHEI